MLDAPGFIDADIASVLEGNQGGFGFETVGLDESNAFSAIESVLGPSMANGCLDQLSWDTAPLSNQEIEKLISEEDTDHSFGEQEAGTVAAAEEVC